jgi:carboxypeptidase C (cathepsin A)
MSGVGFNFAEHKSDMKYNDIILSQENLNALKDFYSKFSEFINHDLYLSGISYAGIHIPNLAYRIHQHNVMAEINHEHKINLKGMIIGNGLSDFHVDCYPALYKIAVHHQLMSKELYDIFEENKCATYFLNVIPPHLPPPCYDAVLKFSKLTEGVNWFNFYEEHTSSRLDEPSMGETIIDGERKTYQRGYKITDFAKWMKGYVSEIGPIFGEASSDYLNRQDVRKALHIPSYTQPWENCITNKNFNFTLQEEGSIWIYPLLKSIGIKIHIFSGTTDGIVPTYGTQQWIKSLDWDIIKEWHPWIIDDQIIGYNQFYDGMNFTTILGIGHDVLNFHKETLELLEAFIYEKEL